MPAITTIRVRKGTSSEWSTANPVLSAGEIGFDTTNKISKVGDGSSTWSALTNNASFALLDVDNIRLDLNTISTTNANGTLILSPNGSGNVNINTSTGTIFLNHANVRVGNSAATANITTTSSASNLMLSTNTNTSSANVLINSGLNGNIILSSAGTGNVNLNVNTGNIFLNNTNIRVGNGAATTNITTTSSTSNLILATNNNSTSANITIQSGLNGNLLLSSVGTGNTNLNVGTGNIFLNNANIRVGNGAATTNIFTTNSTSNLRLSTNAGTSTAFIQIGSGSAGNINLSTSSNTSGTIFLNNANVRVGNASSVSNISTTANTSTLVLSTNNNSVSANIVINAGSNGSININPYGTGSVSMGVNHVTNGSYSTAMGASAETRLLGEVAHTGGSFGSPYGTGISQHSMLTLNMWINGNSSNVLLTLDGGVASSSNKIILPNSGGAASVVWTFSIKVGATFLADNTYSGGWIINGAIKNTWGTVSLIGSVTTETWLDTGVETASVSVTANDTDKTLDIKVSTPTISGETLYESYWTAVVDICQVNYIP